MPFDRIILTGFMGSGKTTVGRLVARELGWQFLDLDDAIEAFQGASVPELFARHGEPHFRTLEAQVLSQQLTATQIVIALGGGAPETGINRLTLRALPRSAVVYLAAPFATLYGRCMSQAADPAATVRPNLMIKEQAEARYARRLQHYEEIATHTIACAELSPQAAAFAVLDALRIPRRG